MTFADLTAGDAVFVDANMLTYHFQMSHSTGNCPPFSTTLTISPS